MEKAIKQFLIKQVTVDGTDELFTTLISEVRSYSIRYLSLDWRRRNKGKRNSKSAYEIQFKQQFKDSTFM